MSNVKYTLGPWTFKRCREESQTILFAVNAANGSRIVHLEPDEYGYGNEEEAKANAQLIAAAPELFEVVNVMLEKYPGAFPFRYREMARAAIAKAEGKQSTNHD